MLDIAQGLEYLHQHNVIHGNIKPQNILISDDSLRAKLVDYGISDALDPVDGTAVITSHVDTLVFKAPEHFLKSGNGRICYTWNMDIFSLSSDLPCNASTFDKFQSFGSTH